MKNKITIILLLLPFLATAGPWPRPKLGGYYKLDHTFILARNFYNPGGKIEPIRTIGNYSTSLYTEYGITDRLTGIVYVPFFVRNTLNETVGNQSGNLLEPGRTNNAFGDMDIGLKYSILNKTPVVLSAGLTLGLPTGDESNSDGLLTGDGEFNQQLRIEAGAGLGKAWVAAGAGFNNRSNGFSDEFRYNIELGVKMAKERLFLILKLDSVESLQNGTATDNPNALFSNNTEYISPQLEAAWKINKQWGISYRFGGAVKGQNILAAPSHSFGVFAEIGN